MSKEIIIKARIVGWVSIWLILLGLSGFERNSCQGTVEKRAVPTSYLCGRLTPPQDLAHTAFDTPIHTFGIYATKHETCSKSDLKLKKNSKDLLCGRPFDKQHQPVISDAFSPCSAPIGGMSHILAYHCRLNI